MNRAVAIDAATSAVRTTASSARPGSSRSVSTSASRAAPQRARRPSASAARSSAAGCRRSPSGSAIARATTSSHASLSVAASTATSSVHEQVGDLGRDVPARGGRRGPPPVLVEAGDHGPEPVALGLEVGQQIVEQVVIALLLVEGSVEGARPLVEDPAPGGGRRRRWWRPGRGRGPGPGWPARARARRRGTRRRRARRRSAGASRGRPRCSSGATAASRVSSVRAATHSSRAAVNTGEVKWSPSILSTRGCAAARSAAARPRPPAPRRAAR